MCLWYVFDYLVGFAIEAFLMWCDVWTCLCFVVLCWKCLCLLDVGVVEVWLLLEVVDCLLCFLCCCDESVSLDLFVSVLFAAVFVLFEMCVLIWFVFCCFFMLLLMFVNCLMRKMFMFVETCDLVVWCICCVVCEWLKWQNGVCSYVWCWGIV